MLIETFWHLTPSDHDFHNLDFMGSSWLSSLSLDIRIVLAFATLHKFQGSFTIQHQNFPFFQFQLHILFVDMVYVKSSLHYAHFESPMWFVVLAYGTD